MKVIPPIDGTGAWQLAIVCDASGNPLDNGCEAALLASATDIFARPLPSDLVPGNPFSYHVQCPCCGAWTAVSPARLPVKVTLEARWNQVPVGQQYFARGIQTY
jgi:hypothetical protein